MRPEAPCHASAEAFSCCVPPVTVRLLVDADSQTVTNVVSRDRNLRYGRVLGVRVASLGRMTRTMAKELKESKFMERSTCADGLLDVDLQRVCRTRSV